MHSYGASVSIRRLFAILVAFSVLLSPGATAAALAAPHHGMHMAQAKHCQTATPKPTDHEKMDGKNCCISMYAAVAVVPLAAAASAGPHRERADFVVPKTYHGRLAEIATPPPRLA